ncbi:MAG: acyl-CoA dehydrogenase family protein [Pseudomonadota bacterium]
MAAEAFIAGVREWLDEHHTEEVRTAPAESDVRNAFVKKVADQGWICPSWPKEYGGAGLSFQEHIALVQEFRQRGVAIPEDVQSRNMIGPTLLEFGTEEQKLRHLPKIARAEVKWCQGYSEPGSGSDLASLSTKAVKEGDHYIVNGQKIWTSGAHLSDWIYVLVRTNPDAPKHEGISLVLMDMDQPGVTVRPIKLISGTSPFCETFFDDAVAVDLIGQRDRGWTIGKRLLQHERAGISGMGASGATAKPSGPERYHLAELARQYIGEDADGRISDSAFRDEIIQHRFNQQAMRLTLARVREENDSGETEAFTTSIFKYVGATQGKADTELQVRIRGCQGTGWEGDAFTPGDIGSTRNWLGSRASSIAGGSNEVQLNIVAKRVLGLPD